MTAKSHPASQPPYNDGPFPLFSDDLRPSNIIVYSDLHLQSVIDWEFCYAAPVEFTCCSPWWLLLAHPDDWEDGFDDSLSHYMPRQVIFLSVLRGCEDEAAAAAQQGDDSHSHGHGVVSLPLSELMERSMQDGTFWFCLAARCSFAFDDIYYKFTDKRYYGEFTSIEDRIALLSVDEQTELTGRVFPDEDGASGGGEVG
ncbi:hypothetical protein FQN52_001904 [Onygenales sp. PD_12]|nr:hypothetical protein FQN52_001904 [Onygenales sp. PD_12]